MRHARDSAVELHLAAAGLISLRVWRKSPDGSGGSGPRKCWESSGGRWGQVVWVQQAGFGDDSKDGFLMSRKEELRLGLVCGGLECEGERGWGESGLHIMIHCTVFKREVGSSLWVRLFGLAFGHR